MKTSDYLNPDILKPLEDESEALVGVRANEYNHQSNNVILISTAAFYETGDLKYPWLYHYKDQARWRGRQRESIYEGMAFIYFSLTHFLLLIKDKRFECSSEAMLSRMLCLRYSEMISAVNKLPVE